MIEIKRIVYTQKFERDVKKTRDNPLKERVKDQVRAIAETPEARTSITSYLRVQLTLSYFGCLHEFKQYWSDPQWVWIEFLL